MPDMRGEREGDTSQIMKGRLVRITRQLKIILSYVTSPSEWVKNILIIKF